MKISQVAETLHIETYVVYENLRLHEEELQAHVHKKNGIVHLDEHGVSKLKRILKGEVIELDDVKKSTHQKADQEVHVDGEIMESEEWLTTEEAILLHDEKNKIRDQIRALRNEMLQLEHEGQRLDESINHYVQQLVESSDKVQPVEEETKKESKTSPADILLNDDGDKGILSFLKR